MKKILLIIQREYSSRVRKPAFIIMSMLVPVLVFVMWAAIYVLSKNSDELGDLHRIKVVDQSGVFDGKFSNKKNLQFQHYTGPLSAAKAELKKNENDYVLYVPKNYLQPKAIELFSTGKPKLNTSLNIESQINSIATSYNMVKAGIDTNKLRLVKTNIDLSSKQITDKGEENSSSGAAYGVGIACAVLIYMSLFIYGAQVMRGVIQEKTNRIIEVIVSSVKPFQLMLGKIIGVGLVGLTQFVIWISFSYLITHFAAKEFHMPNSPVTSFVDSMRTVPVGNLLGVFLFYFLSGYLLYSAIFAAVGSAVDSETETQQFMFPITMPLLFTYFLSVTVLVQNPDSTLAVWLSEIPLTAPIAMMVRFPFHVPDWQLYLSMALMIIGFLCTTWIAARIYRVGILMYGKKASYGELAKWFFYKE